MSSQKQLIVITGGAGGIGMACARAFKNENLIITDYSQEMVDKSVETLSKEGYKASGIPCDITDKKDVEKLRDFVGAQGSLKALIHTAGVSGTVQDLKKVFTIDLVGTELLVDAFYDLAVEDSAIVLLSSMMAHTVPPNVKYDLALANPLLKDSFEVVSQFVDGSSDTMYNFAKRGVLLLSHKNADRFGAKGARIVTVSPGVIETEMALKAAKEHPERMEMIKNATPLKRNGTPEDVSGVVKFLVSDAARFITATDILVDGGVVKNIMQMK
ncbi:MAG TPA: SDR family oxidoreductase [Aequorivita sp.]|nr:SDR family oxidoreductase [Aequorivita sp.]